MITFLSAFQSILVLYGDFTTSLIHVFVSTFHEGIEDKDNILIVLSMFYYTILAIPLVNYMLIVLKTNDYGNGKINPIGLFY
jgi:KUP system potassium uptake protein